MATSIYNNVKISGISMVVPPKEICIDDEIDSYQSAKHISRTKKTVGIERRRIADKGVTATDLAGFAAKTLIRDMDLDKNEIDALIFVVQFPDFLAPASSFILHKKLGLPKKCAALDINHGCAGYVYGLWFASSLIQSGACKKVLMLAADQPTGGPERGESRLLFGDGGAATLLEFSEKINPSYYVLGSDGTGYDAIIAKKGLARYPFNLNDIKEHVDKDGNISFRSDMDGLKVFNFAVKEVPPSIRESLEMANKTKEDIDCYVLHQANKYIIESIADRIGIPIEKAPSSTLAKYGNLSTVSLPAVICDLLREKIISGKQTLLLSGFGIGLAWATCIMDLEKIYCSEIVDYKS